MSDEYLLAVLRRRSAWPVMKCLALEILNHRLWNVVYGRALFRLGPGYSHSAEDIAQQMIIRLPYLARCYRPSPESPNFRRYFLTCTDNLIRQIQRSSGESRVQGVSDPLILETVLPAEESPLDNITLLDDANRLLAPLTPQQQEIFRLKYIFGCSAREIADRLKIPESKVYRLLDTGRKTLRKVLRGQLLQIGDPLPEHLRILVLSFFRNESVVRKPLSPPLLAAASGVTTCRQRLDPVPDGGLLDLETCFLDWTQQALNRGSGVFRIWARGNHPQGSDSATLQRFDGAATRIEWMDHATDPTRADTELALDTGGNLISSPFQLNFDPFQLKGVRLMILGWLDQLGP